MLPRSVLGVVALAVLVMVGCEAPVLEPQVWTRECSYLRSCAPQGLDVGVAVSTAVLADPAAREAVLQDASVITPEWEMKMAALLPSRGVYDFAAADSLVRFAQGQGIRVRGHTLVWHEAFPPWLESETLERTQALALLREYIGRVVARYRGEIAVWDVVNEAFDAQGQYRPSPWYRWIGPEYVEWAFRFAHEADPQARLYYNDYDLEWGGPKLEAVLSLVRNLRLRGVPIHGVGFQAHHRVDHLPSSAQWADAFRRVRESGLEVSITELDIRVPLPLQPSLLQAQAQGYARVLSACRAEPACVSFSTWGVGDRGSWVPGFFPGWGGALLRDEEYRPKPAYWAVRNALADPRKSLEMSAADWYYRGSPLSFLSVNP